MEGYARVATMRVLHPVAREAFMDLQAVLDDGSAGPRLMIYETYRSPERQAYLAGTVGGQIPYGTALMWRSPHQYGLAVNVVPWVDREDPTTQSWTFDIELAHELMSRLVLPPGLVWRPEKPFHVECEAWGEVRRALVPKPFGAKRRQAKA